MQNNKPNGTRITVERTRNQSQKIYCDVCQKEIEFVDRPSSPLIENEQTDVFALPAADVLPAPTKANPSTMPAATSRPGFGATSADDHRRSQFDRKDCTVIQ
ncbi:MAG TPA: hypothetical protein PKC89_03615 [Pyrinomonadaceae bacterium]|nr:hypothetical protein [Pyrinomonadaceae bacterium]